MGQSLLEIVQYLWFVFIFRTDQILFTVTGLECVVKVKHFAIQYTENTMVNIEKKHKKQQQPTNGAICVLTETKLTT